MALSKEDIERLRGRLAEIRETRKQNDPVRQERIRVAHETASQQLSQAREQGTRAQILDEATRPRNLWEATKKVGRSVGGFVKDVALEAPARSTASILLEGREKLGGSGVHQPEGRVEKFFMGDEPIKSLSRRIEGAETELQDFGVGEKASKSLAPIGVAGFTGLDFLLGTGKNVKTGLKVLSKMKKTDEVLGTLKKFFPRVSDDLAKTIAPKIAKTADKDVISNAIKAAELISKAEKKLGKKVPVSLRAQISQQIDTITDPKTATKKIKAIEKNIEDSFYLSKLPDNFKTNLDELNKVGIKDGKELLARANKMSDNIDLKKLNLDDELRQTEIRMKKAPGKEKPFSKLPVLVKRTEDGLYDIIDGRHRVVDAMNEGKNKIKVIENEILYRKLSEGEEAFVQLEKLKPKKTQFIKDTKGKFAGSKRVIPKKQEAAGGVVGFEKDKEGNIKFDPKKAALGVAGVSVAKSRKAQKVLDKAAKTYGTKTKKSLFKAKDKVPTKTKASFKRGMEKLLTPIATRLGKIAPELKTAVRKLDFESGVATLKDSKHILPFLKASKKIKKIDKNDFKLLDMAMKNSDMEVLNALGDKYGLTDELKQVRKVLDDIHTRGNKMGMDIDYRGDYFPRVIKDAEGLMTKLRGQDGWSQIQKAIDDKARSLDINPDDLKPAERASIVNNLLRGYGDKIRLVAPTHTKGRTIEFLSKDLDKYYDDSSTALVKYISKMNEEIAGRKFFGKELGIKPNQLNSSDSIGSYVMKLIADGKIKPSQEKEISDILKARFSTGKMNEALQAYRNVEYLATMGNPISAVTQIGDMAWSLAENGFYRTAKGAAKSLFGKGIKKEQLGIEKIAQEFADFSKTSKMVDKVFNAVGLTKIDRIGKETLINGYWDRITKQAKKGNPKLMDDLKVMFGGDADRVMEDIADKKLTDDAKFALFNNLADFQPISKAEMPEKYLSSPNGRIFYMLKSFTLKQLDVFRRNVFSEIASKEPKRVAKGLRNLVVIGGTFMLANATADEIKDWMLGRKTSLADRTIDNLMRLGGLSKYDIYNVRNEGIGLGMAKKILFPTSIADAIGRDVENIVTDKRYKKGKLKGQKYKSELTQRIPIVGKMLYWWGGRGKQKSIYKEGGTTNRPTPARPTPTRE